MRFLLVSCLTALLDGAGCHVEEGEGEEEDWTSCRWPCRSAMAGMSAFFFQVRRESNLGVDAGQVDRFQSAEGVLPKVPGVVWFQ